MTHLPAEFDPKTPGWDGTVYAIQHYGNGTANVVGYRYLAHTEAVVIASPYADEGYEDIIAAHLEETTQNGVTELCVFDIHECFTSKKAAEAVLNT